jgi:site-specific recombinase XerD
VKAFAEDLKAHGDYPRGRRQRQLRHERLPFVEAHVSASTVNRKLSALAAFYQHQMRHGVDVVSC